MTDLVRMSSVGCSNLTSQLRDQKSVQLKALHWSLTDICRELGYPSETEAHYGIQRGIAAAARFVQDEARSLEEAGLNELELRLWRLMDMPMPMVNHGQVVRGSDGQPIQDLRFQLDVTDRIAKIKAQRAKLRGLNAPTRTEIISIDLVEAEIMRLESEVRGRTDQLPTTTQG